MSKQKNKAKALWGGRFSKSLAADAKAFSYSLAVDGALLDADIRVSIAHATMLTHVKLLSKKEGAQIVRGLQAVHTELKKAKLADLVDTFEDVHTLIQEKLEKKIGSVARKLHTGRSRNDLVATSTRIYTKEKIRGLILLIDALNRALVGGAEKHIDTAVPGYTHLQRAQVVSVAQHFLAYAEMFERDRDRFTDVSVRMDELPLGSAALGGTSLPLDRRYVQKLLRFWRLSGNSMDAVSDRDFALETLSAAALLFMHLSRLAEDLILWSTSEFSYVTLSDLFTTGSSLMPQKKNPDMLELIRGKSGRVYGNLVSLLVTMKGLPMTYNRDMQEDKPPLFDSLRTSETALAIMAGVIETMKINVKKTEAACADPALYATDLADYLVRKGVAFKDAHDAVGRLVRSAEGKGVSLADLSAADFKKAHKQFGPDVKKLFSARRSLESKVTLGSTSPSSVRAQLVKWKALLRAHS